MPVADNNVSEIRSQITEVDNLQIHYLEAAPLNDYGLPPILLLHGFPTSSCLWRNIIPVLARKQRVVAIDLPGYGKSDKPLEASYGFRFYQRILEGFLENLGIHEVSLVVHDIGGPLGLYWAIHRPDRIKQLALLNTVVFSKLPWAAVAFLLSCKTPGLRHLVASPLGLKYSLYLGMQNHERINEELIRQIQSPFSSKQARQALLKAGVGVTPTGLKYIENNLSAFTMPVRIIYGAKDLILSDMENTARRLGQILPQVEVTVLPHCGHFLQEDDPEQVASLLADFFVDGKSMEPKSNIEPESVSGIESVTL